MNTNAPKILFIVIIAVLVINLGFNLFGSSAGLKQAVRNLETARKKLDSAMVQLQQASAGLDSIQANLERQRVLINDIRYRTELMDLEKRVRDTHSQEKIDSIKERIKVLSNYQPADEIVTEDLK
ncbi:MAG TPA: hypothetical protein VFS25_09300 [Chitinophaga sp.]|jgi:Tfp pilus assembly protein PilO|uniref:hypothetical protein n=1 Tax=Chitinophaga sp. TaxID=1869181 RepID=UPI002DBB2973|nr:hypothetical protein [Chitinophaga sp.]HEU4553019.1 hypothetical protein [Chitinophaga sp.]